MKRMITATLTNRSIGKTAKQEDMKANLIVKQYLIDNGFTYVGTCNCGGSLTYKFEYATTKGKLNLRTRASTFLLAKVGERFNKYPISELKKTVDAIKRDYESPVADA